MSSLILSWGLALALQDGDTGKWVEQLGAEEIEVRAEAERHLKALGEEARTALEEGKKSN